MSKHSSIFSVSIPTREQRADADKMAFPQPGKGRRRRRRRWWWWFGGAMEGRGSRMECGLRGESRRDSERDTIIQRRRPFTPNSAFKHCSLCCCRVALVLCSHKQLNVAMAVQRTVAHESVTQMQRDLTCSARVRFSNPAQHFWVF